MEFRRIEPAQIRAAWYRFCKNLNDQQPRIQRIRNVKNKKTGILEPQIFYTRKSVVSPEVMDTGGYIITKYLDSYIQVAKSEILSAAYSDGELPSLFTNCVKLGSNRGRSDRTIRNHIRRLQAKGIELISDYKFHGTKHDFELWINPKFLFPEPVDLRSAARNQKFQNAQNSPVSAPQRINFPVNTALELPETKEIVIGNVDNSGVAMQQGTMPIGDGISGGTSSGGIGPHKATNHAGKATARPIASTAPEAQSKRAAAAPKKPIPDKFRDYVLSFWFYACKMLYPDWNFTPDQERKAKNAIFEGVYFGFRGDFTAKERAEYQEALIERIDLAAAYFRKHPDKYPPKPYAEFLPGTGYFDWENKRGFSGTHDWLVSRNTWRLQQREDEALRKARRELKAHHLTKAPRRLQEKSLMELFRHHENKIKPFGEKALERFYAQNQVFHVKLNQKPY